MLQDGQSSQIEAEDLWQVQKLAVELREGLVCSKLETSKDAPSLRVYKMYDVLIWDIQWYRIKSNSGGRRFWLCDPHMQRCATLGSQNLRRGIYFQHILDGSFGVIVCFKGGGEDFIFLIGLCHTKDVVGKIRKGSAIDEQVHEGSDVE
ncbi:unnamed protein product [Clavelina lepadiformis]|uniref:Uncharacterized protein n=1 Tax=Clavelina lepadiformis TaxID=159417 RepID=A0ABP0G2Q2_CLALP